MSGTKKPPITKMRADTPSQIGPKLSDTGDAMMVTSTPASAPSTLKARTRSTSHPVGEPAASSRLRIRSICPEGVRRRPRPLLSLRNGFQTRSPNGLSSSLRMLAGAALNASMAARLLPTCSLSPVSTPTVASAITTAQKIATRPTMSATSAMSLDLHVHDLLHPEGPHKHGDHAEPDH